jgi:hypothetical protein
MKVKELIELLAGYDENAIVLLSSDEEGNSYSPCEPDVYLGNFDTEKGTFADPKNFIYTMEEDEMHGEYVVLYPR